MREILFRGKREDNGEWVEGCYSKGFRNPNTAQLEDLIYMFSGKPGEWEFDYAVVIPETVGQYTGLTDKNGKKIFEGDIIKDRNNALHIVKIGEYFPDHFFRICCNSLEPVKLCNLYGVYAERITNDEHKGDHFVVPPKNAVEVIGNIHDNPELLKGGGEE